MHVCICIHIYVYICNHGNNVSSWLSPEWLCANSWLMHLGKLLVSIYLSIFYLYICTHISGHKWSTTDRGLKFHKSKIGLMYIQSRKQCVLLVITTMALWQLMHSGTQCTIVLMCIWCGQLHELPWSHCHNNQESTLFSWLL